ncbi:DUF2029 domain-containing protein [Acidobacteria bacterium ACD]|nr:MAG: DUF2029 domain-containing protein [Acidobacteriota bacterium]MCE7957750.1 DUF2029 domain-containing protein [Acidobacteria bacterium ACB2]MDL1950215.1 DUF2029 domain-containing protein [Acidobacteria bacterium ACD]
MLRRSPLQRVYRVAVLVTVALFVPRVVASSRGVRGGEFAAYWTAARLVSEGAPVDRFYEDAEFRAHLRANGIAQNDIWYPNPPTTALVFLPLSGRRYEAARAAWVGLSGLLLVGMVALLARAAALEGGLLAAFVLFGLHGQPSLADLGHGQAYAFVTALLAVAARAFVLGRPRAFGSLLGVLAPVKLAGGHLWLLAIPRRLRTGLLWGVGSAAILVLLSVPFVGLAGWRAFLTVPGRIASDPTFSVTAFQSLGGLVRRLFVPDPTWNPRPLLDAPFVADALVVAAQLALAGIVLALGGRDREPGLALSAAVLAGLLASPFSQDYTYVQAVVPAAFVLSALQGGRVPGRTLAAFAGLLLIGASGWHKSAAFQDGAAALLAYPKVYGALILLVLTVQLSTEPQRDRSEPRPLAS